MKKLMLAFLAAGTIASANAQEPHSILLYGNAGIHNSSDTGKNNTFNWNVSPGIGYQFNDNWTVGLNLNYGQNTYKVNGANERYSDNYYGVGVFGRFSHYIKESKTFFWYGQLDLGYNGQYSTEGSKPSFNKATGFAASLYPALGINVGCHWALNFSIGGVGYNTYKADGAANGTSSFDFTLGQQYNVGVSKNFGSGKKMHGHREPGDDMRGGSMENSNEDNDNDSGNMKKHHHKNKKDSDDNDD